jgi:phosphoenolpyruvate synthase/pyruvate phosphate dikinase
MHKKTKLEIRINRIDVAIEKILRDIGKYKNPELMIDLLERIKENLIPNF